MQQEQILSLSGTDKKSQTTHDDENGMIDWEQVTLFKMGADSLVECGPLDKIETPLRRIFLLGTQINAESVKEMCENSHWKGLKILQIYGGNLTESSIQLLLGSEWEELEELRLVECNLNDECLDLLMNHSKWHDLKVLDVSKNNLTLNGFENAIKEMKLPSLECLFVDETFSEETLDSESILATHSKLRVLYGKKGDLSLDSDEVYVHILLKQALNGYKEKDPKSLLNLAHLLRNNYLLPFEVKEVSSLTLESAISGCVEANYFAGMLFYKEHFLGDEYISNPLKTKYLSASNQVAKIWFEKGADKMNPGCMYRLGEFYEYGKSVGQSDREAFEWYKKAGDLNYPDALMRVAEFHCLGIATPVDEEKGIEFMKKAATFGSLKALRLLAGFYENGNISESGKVLVERDLDLADQTYCSYLELKTDADILFKAGCLHLYGEEWEHADIKYGVSCLQQSSKLGNSKASFTLGNFFLNIQQEEMAYFYFLESSKQGHARAEEALSIFQVIDSRNPDQ